MTMNRFRFVDPRRFARARDEHCERKLLLRARGTDHRQSYSTRLHCTYQLAWRQGITFVRLGLFKQTTPSLSGERRVFFAHRSADLPLPGLAQVV
jgi:hypothetical protein